MDRIPDSPRNDMTKRVPANARWGLAIAALFCGAVDGADSQVRSDSSVYTDVMIELVATDSTPLVGKLSIPRGASGAVPVVFYLHGAGPRSYDHPVRYRAADGQVRTIDYYDFYARGLAREGLSFFRLAKRGCAIDSTGRLRAERAVFSGATPTVLLDDYMRALEVLRGRREVDANRIVLYGTSEGTRLAPQLALRAPDGIVGLVLASYQSDNQHSTVVWQNTVGPWRNVRFIFPAATDSGLHKTDYDEAVTRNAALGTRIPFAVFDTDSNGTMTPNELAALNRPRLDAILKAVEARNDDFLWQSLLNLSSAYLLDGWDGTPTSDILVRLDVPIGIFHGALDGATRVEGVRETEAAFLAARKSNLTVRIYPNYDHDLGWTPATAERGGTAPFQDSFRFAASLVRAR